jgi:hypothetical protein
MTRRILLLLVCVLAWPATLVQAQSSSVLSDLKISFWPEYDRPAMLVIYRGQVAPDTPVPAALQIQIPARYGPPIAMAYIDNGQLFNLDYTATPAGDSLILAFTSPNGSFQIEYYDTSLDLSSTARHYTFAAASPYAIQTVTLQVQQPIDTTSVTGVPALAAPEVGLDGFTYHNLVLTDLKPGDPIRLDVTYTKTTDALTIENFAPAATATPSVSEQTQNNWLYGVLGAVAVLLVVVGLIWYAWPKRSRRKNKASGAAARKPEAVAPRSAGGVFCHECGTKGVAGDRFCRNCGTELRHSSDH